MLLANLGWLLAAAGQRVLMIDWDFEAPGLHRYYRVFLDDPDLTETHGLLDFLQEFVDGSRLQLLESKKASVEPAPNWFEEFARLSRFSIPIDHEFPGEGSLELIGAGRQGPAYSQSVNSFHWDDFYSKSGGGVFLERVKDLLRQEYDYILIDSRTGLSDTAGICTIQMPDDLVLCLTLNRQNIEGAEAVGRSASQARRKPSGAPGLRVWPVAMRVELAEKDRLEKARRLCRDRLTFLAWQLNLKQRADYWRDMEILYYPYYAYEEILAPIADTPGSRATLLDNVMSVGRRIVSDLEREETGVNPTERQELLADSLRLNDRVESSLNERVKSDVVVLSETERTSSAQFRTAAHLCERLNEDFHGRFQFRHETVESHSDESTSSGPDCGIAKERSKKFGWLELCAAVVLVFPSHPTDLLSVLVNELFSHEVKVIVCHLRPSSRELNVLNTQSLHALRRLSPRNWVFLPWHLAPPWGNPRQQNLAPIKNVLKHITRLPRSADQCLDDPQKGRWGGISKSDQFQLAAKVLQPNPAEKWFEVWLSVNVLRSDDSLVGPIEFYLHPDCVPSPQVVEPETPHQATLRFHTHRAFTVGVSLRGGEVRLEVDLRDVPGAPQAFVES